MLSEVDLKFMKEDELIVAGNGLGNAAARFVRNTHHDGRIKTWKGYPWDDFMQKCLFWRFRKLLSADMRQYLQTRTESLRLGSTLRLCSPACPTFVPSMQYP